MADSQQKVVRLVDELEQVTKHWAPRVVGQVNDQFVKVAKLRGELVWHSHDAEDELFLVVRGRLRIQLEGHDDVHLGPGEFYWFPEASCTIRSRTRKSRSS